MQHSVHLSIGLNIEEDINHRVRFIIELQSKAGSEYQGNRNKHNVPTASVRS